MTMNWKELGRSRRGLTLRYYPSIRLEGLCKTTETLNYDSRRRDSKPGPPEYEVGMLTSRTRRAVSRVRVATSVLRYCYVFTHTDRTGLLYFPVITYYLL
jgi:hypothetical protein